MITQPVSFLCTSTSFPRTLQSCVTCCGSENKLNFTILSCAGNFRLPMEDDQPSIFAARMSRMYTPFLGLAAGRRTIPFHQMSSWGPLIRLAHKYDMIALQKDTQSAVTSRLKLDVSSKTGPQNGPGHYRRHCCGRCEVSPEASWPCVRRTLSCILMTSPYSS